MDDQPAAKIQRRAFSKDMLDVIEQTRRNLEEDARGARVKGKGKAREQIPKKRGGRKNEPADLSLAGSTSIGGNVFDDAVQNRDLPAQPTSKARPRKDQALESSIASVPDESRPVAKIDKKFRDDASMLPCTPDRTKKF